MWIDSPFLADSEKSIDFVLPTTVQNIFIGYNGKIYSSESECWTVSRILLCQENRFAISWQILKGLSPVYYPHQFNRSITAIKGYNLFIWKRVLNFKLWMSKISPFNCAMVYFNKNLFPDLFITVIVSDLLFI